MGLQAVPPNEVQVSSPPTDSEDPSLLPEDDDDWERLRTLVDAASGGELPDATDELREYVARVARQTGMDDRTISQMGADPQRILRVAQEARKRIRTGSQRLMIAMNTAFAAADDGNHGEAERVLRQVIETEVVPYYRELARINLEQLGAGSSGDDE